MTQPDSTTTPGLRCDCALRFENRRAIYEHVVQTGHLKARTCMPCRKVFRRKIGLKAHQQSSHRHQRMLAVTTSTQTTAAVVSTGKSKRKRRGKKSKVTDKASSQADGMEEQGGRNQAAKPRQPHPFWFLIKRKKEKQRKKRLAQAKLMDEARKEAGASVKASINSGNPTGSTTKPAAKVLDASATSGNTGPTESSESERPPWINPKSYWNFGSVMYGCFLDPKTLKPLGPPSPEPSTSQAGGASLSQDAEQKKEKKKKSNKKKKRAAAMTANENTTTVTPTTTNTTNTNNKAMTSNPPTSQDPAVPPSRDYRATYPWISPLPGRAIYAKLRGLCLSPQDQQGHECYRVIPAPAPAGATTMTTTPRWLAAPPRDPRSHRPFGVALDCEMVEVVVAAGAGRKPRRDELARLCVVDLITGAVLIDALVQPTQPVADWRTRHSGVSAGLLAASPTAPLAGWPAARALLLRLIDRDTIVAGHALHHDLAALGVAHARALDTSTATARFAFDTQKLRRRWGLGTLMRELCGLRVQDNGAQGHDCVEDALAARELALLCATEPARMREWGVSARERFEREERERAEKQREKTRRERVERERERKVREPDVAEVVRRMELAEVVGWESGVGGGW
ncbi:hypothetical protein F4775DRAFT_606910 [Biscogniauxia sp. FL1348]|nr:hypothetical protein F4775DRAFT_606910 [Biscogniauxia sp. FL1348]